MLRSRGGAGVAYARHAPCRRDSRRLRPTRMGAGHSRRCPRSRCDRRCHGRQSHRAGASCVCPAGCRQERGPPGCRKSRPRRPGRRAAGISEPALCRPCDVSGRRRSGAPGRPTYRPRVALAQLLAEVPLSAGRIGDVDRTQRLGVEARSSPRHVHVPAMASATQKAVMLRTGTDDNPDWKGRRTCELLTNGGQCVCAGARHGGTRAPRMTRS
jgi:hypothetical protein